MDEDSPCIAENHDDERRDRYDNHDSPKTAPELRSFDLTPHPRVIHSTLVVDLACCFNAGQIGVDDLEADSTE